MRNLAGGLGAVVGLAVLGLGVLAWMGGRLATALLTPASVAALLAETQRPDPGDPAQALGLPFEAVAADTELGPAPAWWVPAGAGPEARLAAVVVHGIGGRRADGYDVLPLLRAAGVPTLLISYRNDAGAPASPSGFYGLGLTEWRDLEAAVRWVQAQGHERFLLVGASMGGAIVGQFMARSDEAPAVAALAFDSAAFDAGDALAHLARRAGLPLPRLAAGLGAQVAAWRTGTDLPIAVVTDAVASFPGPVFVTHGTSDSVVPVASADEVVARRVADTTYVRTTGDHLQGFTRDADLVGPAFAAFLSQLR